jgi:spermidine synthase
LPADKRISVIEGDGRRFIIRNKKTWDVVIFAVPDPSSLQINRYYTVDFLKILKSRLNKDAVVLFGVSPAGNYISPEQTGIEAAIYHSVASQFRNVVIIPGERDYFIASDATLSDKPGELASLRGLKASYVNPDYMDDQTITGRGNLIREKIDQVRLIDTDMQPLPVFYHTLQYLSRFTGKNLYLMLLPILLFILPLFFMNPVSAGMYVTGLTASSVEILLIFWFQTVFGNVYSAIGIIFAIFMGGLALGSDAGFRLKTDRRHFLWGQVLLGIYTMLLPFLWYLKGASMSGFFVWLLFIPVLLIPAILTGFQYVTSTMNYCQDQQHAASAIYSADLWGSALGAILITFLLVPLLGVTTSCLIIAALNGLIVIYMLLRK